MHTQCKSRYDSSRHSGAALRARATNDVDDGEADERLRADTVSNDARFERCIGGRPRRSKRRKRGVRI